MTGSGKEWKQYLCFTALNCYSALFFFPHFSMLELLPDWLIDWQYSWGFMEWWDSIGCTKLLQQLYPVYQEWVLFLVTTLKCCVFVCPSLFIAVLTVAYTHTDGYHSLGWRSNSPLCLRGHNETAACFFRYLINLLRLRKFWDKVHLDAYLAGIFQMIPSHFNLPVSKLP